MTPMGVEPFNICVLFDTIDVPTGGGNQFLKALIAELRRLGASVTTRPTPQTQVVLLNGFNRGSGRPLRISEVAQIRQTGRMGLGSRLLPLRYIESRPRRGPALVHRVDGVPRLTRGRVTRADGIQPAVNALADHTVYQSDFCRASFNESCDHEPKSWRVIRNAVDPRIFYPPVKARQPDRVMRMIATSWSPNVRKGFATLAEISRLPTVDLTFAGNWCPDVDPAQTRLVGPLPSSNLAELLRSSDAMIHAAFNEPCSNSIVEALACGLPVLFRDSGGNRELVGDYGVALTENLGEAVATLAGRWSVLRERVLDHRPRFLIPRAAAEYLAAFRHAIESPEAADAA